MLAAPLRLRIERASSGVNGSAPEAVATPEPEPPAAAPEPAPEPEPTPEPEPAPAPEAREEPKREERHRERQEEDDEAQEHKGVKHRPQPKHGREPIPVPAGQVIYDSLKTSFVDFPRLITTLERESYTGYVRLLTENASGLIFFKEGTALECVYDVGEDPAVDLGKKALREFNEEVTHGHGVLDVVGLSPELVDGLYELTVAQPVYTELYASWVDVTALLKFLEQRKLSGSLMVRSTAGTGVIILTDGKLTGAYTSDSREIAASAEGVLALRGHSLEHERRDLVGVGGGEHGREPEIAGSQHGRALAADRRQHRLEIVHLLLQRGRARDRVREPGPAPVELDQPRERGQFPETPRRSGLLPHHLQMGGGAVDRDQIDRALAGDLVGDARLCALGIAGSRGGAHGQINVTEPARWFTNMCSINQMRTANIETTTGAE